MALLQAARAYTLGLPLESAYSWGLNRAIFIAAAKRGFKGGGGGRTEPSAGRASKSPDAYFLGDDMAFKTEKNRLLLFTIGGEVQTKELFNRQVVSRFGAKFPQAWKEALHYVKEFDRDTLASAEDFYRLVYKPVRDDLAAKWTEATA
ncbi:MAG TPA: hypothetical protein VLU91_02710 [Nitrososphaerales archaeon]|nr:hypothetical protein [Nitrososphaerales archaeon]